MRIIQLACFTLAAPLVILAIRRHNPAYFWAGLALVALPVIVRAIRQVRVDDRARADALERRFQELRVQYPDEDEKELRAQAKLELWSSEIPDESGSSNLTPSLAFAIILLVTCFIVITNLCSQEIHKRFLAFSSAAEG